MKAVEFPKEYACYLTEIKTVIQNNRLFVRRWKMYVDFNFSIKNTCISILSYPIYTPLLFPACCYDIRNIFMNRSSYTILIITAQSKKIYT
jgi:hypothetical protein